jgi:hypothetical protein
MKGLIVVVLVTVSATPLAAPLRCDFLRAEIEAKLRANGVRSFSLQTLPINRISYSWGASFSESTEAPTK